MLGVAVDAAPDELRQAYRARARALHPDRHPDDVRAGEAMRAVNAAWAVLSDPAARASYDRRLGGGDAEPVDDMVPDERTADLLVGLVTRHRTVRVGVSAVVLVVLFVIFVVTAYAGGGTGTPR